MAWNPDLLASPANSPANSLLRDVLTILEEHELSRADVLFVELDLEHRWCFFDGFAVTASLIDLDGQCSINQELRIVGDDWYLERNELNDGWDYRMLPAQETFLEDVPYNLLTQTCRLH